MARRSRKKGKPSDVLLRSAEWIGWALGGLEREIADTRSRLAVLTTEAAKLRARIGTGARRIAGAAPAPVTGAGKRTTRRRGRMSAAGRRRISEMMKKRWAEAKRKKRNRL